MISLLFSVTGVPAGVGRIAANTKKLTTQISVIRIRLPIVLPVMSPTLPGTRSVYHLIDS